MRPKYKRILLKFSGEALANKDHNFGVDFKTINSLALEVANLIKLKLQVGLVIGGGNFFRGKDLKINSSLDNITSDQIGMLATVINSLIFGNALEQLGIKVIVMSAIPILGIVNLYNYKKAIQYLENNYVVIFAGGTANPLVTTDTAASLRAIEISAEVFLKATTVNGIYPKDPKKYSNLVQYNKITYNEIISKELAVMDLSALIQCRNYNMPIIVFNINKKEALLNIIYGKEEGTLVTGR